MSERKSPELRRFVVCPVCDGRGEEEMKFNVNGKEYSETVACTRCGTTGQIDILRESWLRVVFLSTISASTPVSLFFAIYFGVNVLYLISRGSDLSVQFLLDLIFLILSAIWCLVAFVVTLGYGAKQIVNSIKVIRRLGAIEKQNRIARLETVMDKSENPQAEEEIVEVLFHD